MRRGRQDCEKNRQAVEFREPVGAFRISRTIHFLLFFILQVSSFSLLLADIHYVDIASTNPVPPYTNWPTAATVIQDAIDWAVSNDTVLVADGVYSNGGVAVYGSMTNRVAITNAITVQSVNGPAFAFIVGKGVGINGASNGNGAVRCAYMTNGATLVGFTLTNGHTRIGGDSLRERNGGGVWCQSVAVFVSNCVIRCNLASQYGGGSYYGTLNNCTISVNSASQYGGGSFNGTINNCAISGNSASLRGGGSYMSTLNNCTISGNTSGDGGGSCYGILNNCTIWDNTAGDGGGSYGVTLNNCTISGNSAENGGGSCGGTLNNCTISGNTAAKDGGGSYGGILNNCIVYYNSADTAPNISGSACRYCCTTPKPGGTGNIASEPIFVSPCHIASNSPCAGAGSSTYASGVDMDGDAWRNPPSIGCDEPVVGTLTGMLSVAISAEATNMIAGATIRFMAGIGGRVSRNVWLYGDGTEDTNRVYAFHAWSSTGQYEVVLRVCNETYPDGVAATVRVEVVSAEGTAKYVREDSPSPAWPYDSWTNAARTIQEAVDAQVVYGGWVWVSNGAYSTGARVTPGGSLSNRVVITKNVAMKSVNGPGVTLIIGQGVGNGGTNNGPGAVRCVYIAAGRLEGFSLTNGHTKTSGSDKDISGGGAYALGSSLTNCALIGNSAEYGGGLYYGTLNNCTISDNSASQFGGGSYYGILNNCTISDNSAYLGGGSYYGTFNNCSISGNSASQSGGGSYYGTFNNCTISGNSASWSGGGSYYGTFNNCIVYYNSAGNNPNISGGTYKYCCTTPNSGGTGNIASEPKFVFLGHIAIDSPCAGAGNFTNAFGVDIDGDTWGNPPSMGCDEPVVGTLTGIFSVAISAEATNMIAEGATIRFVAEIGGRVSRNVWSYGDETEDTNRVYAFHAWGSTGQYEVVLRACNETYPDWVAATVRVEVVSAEETAKYVREDSPTPSWPYNSWTNAARTIQEAVDAQDVHGGWVWVSNGVYSAGGGVTPGGLLSNRVVITKNIVVKSVNGPWMTLIVGQGVGSGGTNNGPGSVRCVYISAGRLEGFTLTNGHTRTSGDYRDINGGGAYASGGLLTNCALIGNSAYLGGGSYYGPLDNCAILGNSAYCGGGSYYGTLNNCIISNNSAEHGGGSSYGTLNNCMILDNMASLYGGGSRYGTLNNCTISGNSAGYGGGSYDGTLNNCIVYYNSAGTNLNISGSKCNYCCTTPNPSGQGSITNAPEFRDLSGGDYRLKINSPCIDRGVRQEWMASATDLDGNPRIINGCVDMGAYEFGFDGNLKTLVQGAYDSNLNAMATDLNIPLIPPYSVGREAVASVPSNAVDWVLLQVRPGSTNSPVVSRSLFLRNDGMITDAAGDTNILIEVPPMSTNYLVVSHRNHLSVMSAQPLVFTNQLMTYDFTTNWTCYYGGTNACVELEPGVWGMIAGDADGDGKITPVDRKIVEQQAGKTGYLPGDLNLDGVVTTNEP